MTGLDYAALVSLVIPAAILYRRSRYLRRALTVEANRRQWARIELQNARREWSRARLRYRQARRAAVVDMHLARRAARIDRSVTERKVRRANRR